MTLRRKCNGAKHTTEASDQVAIFGGRGAFPMDRRKIERFCGLLGSDYADMSNDKTGEKPVRRKPKVSRCEGNLPGVSRPLRQG